MTEQQAIEFVRRCGEQDGPDTDEEAAEVFFAIYGREPDAEDAQAGVWSLCCAAVPEPARQYREDDD